MDEEPRTKTDPWDVVPLTKTASKKRKALRIALIVAALGAAALAAVRYCGNAMRENMKSNMSGLWGQPVHEDIWGKPVQVSTEETRRTQQKKGIGEDINRSNDNMDNGGQSMPGAD